MPSIPRPGLAWRSLTWSDLDKVEEFLGGRMRAYALERLPGLSSRVWGEVRPALFVRVGKQLALAKDFASLPLTLGTIEGKLRQDIKPHGSLPPTVFSAARRPLCVLRFSRSGQRRELLHATILSVVPVQRAPPRFAFDFWEHPPRVLASRTLPVEASSTAPRGRKRGRPRTYSVLAIKLMRRRTCKRLIRRCRRAHA